MSTSSAASPVMPRCVDCGADSTQAHDCPNSYDLSDEQPERKAAEPTEDVCSAKAYLGKGKIYCGSAPLPGNGYTFSLGAIPPIKTRIKMHDFTVSFYSLNSEPESLPPFPYAVAGSVLGHTKFVAFVRAPCASDSQYIVSDFFAVAQVESIQPGVIGMQEAPLRGTIGQTEPRGLFSRILRFFLGDA